MTFLKKQTLFAIACSIVSMYIKNVKVKAFFNNNVEINYIIKKLTQKTLLLIRKETIISLIIIIENKTCFLNVCNNVKIRLEKVIVIIFIFVIN